MAANTTREHQFYAQQQLGEVNGKEAHERYTRWMGLNRGAVLNGAIGEFDWDGLDATLVSGLPETCFDGAGWKANLWLSDKGAMTPFHFDMTSTLHTPIHGEKCYLLAPPSEANWLLAVRFPWPPRAHSCGRRHWTSLPAAHCCAVSARHR